MSSLRTLAYTTFALVAFAANSVLGRLALGEETIDAASFSTIRLVSGALTLVLVSALVHENRAGHSANWGSAVVLFLYAVPFSYAYVTLSTGTGARGGPRFSDRLLRWSPDPTGGIWNATQETELPG